MASLQKNVASQHIKFVLVSATTGGADSGATVTVKVAKDAGAQASGGGTVTNLGNGQYDYAPTQGETNATDVGFLFTATGDIPVHADFHTDVVDANALPSVNVADWNAVSLGATNPLPNAVAGAAGGLWILGANAAATTTLTGVAASGASPATAALSLTGGAADTTSGGTSAAGLVSTGGAGAASTNGAGDGVQFVGGGTTTVAGGAGLTLTHTGSGKDFNAQTTNALQVNATAINAVSTGSVTTVSAILGTTVAIAFDANNLPKVDLEDIRGTASFGAAGYVGIDWGHVTAPTTAVDLVNTTIGTVTNQLTAAQIATGIWQDSTAGDFTAAGSIGKSLAPATLGTVPGAAGGLLIAGSNAATSFASGSHFIGTVDTVTTVTNQLTAAAIATSVWQDTTSGDFTVSSSIGKSLYTSGNAPGAANGLALVGSNMGAVTSVTGSVGSVTGNVGGNVVGSVGSISGVTFPTNFNLLAIDGSGDVTYNNAAPPTTAQIFTAVWTTALTESYSALHAAPTPAQAVFEVLSRLVNQSLGGTQTSTGTCTAFKLDGSTTAFTMTIGIDASGNFISSTRAT